ncbi:hypothetical protein F5Y07DRAFT_242397 [Xylaria sp. FL0933]|nr:hypothetical protein F5Y07DRAFT_242397 [Xylaria sp. FL0933]
MPKRSNSPITVASPPRSRVKLSEENGTIKDKQEASHLMQLPVEMILHISKYLPASDLACFALSCKPVFTILDDLECFRVRMRREVKEKGIFLSRLEGSVMGLVYSPIAERLVNFDRDGKVFLMVRNSGRTFYSLSEVPRPFYYWSCTDATFYHSEAIRYEQTRLMRNYQLFGPQYGIPPSALSYEKRVQERKLFLAEQECQTRSEDSRTLRWIDGELFLSRTSTICLEGPEPRGARSSALIDLLTRATDILCRHCPPGSAVSLYTGLGDGFDVITDIHENNLRGSPSCSLGRCKFCESDWEISVSMDGSTGVVARVRTWHNLGSCSYPLDSKWERIVSPSWYRPQLRHRASRKMEADVMQKWMEAEAEAEAESLSSSGGCSTS